MNIQDNNSLKHEETIKVKFTNKEVLNIVYKGRVIRFKGELGLHEFMASIDSAKWLYPKDEKKITQREKEEIITTVCKQYNNKKIRICFCDKNYNVVVHRHALLLRCARAAVCLRQVAGKHRCYVEPGS